MSLTKLELLTRVAQRWGYWFAGTCASATTTTFVCSSLIEPDTFWVGQYVNLTTDTTTTPPTLQERAVTAYVRSTALVTFAPALVGAYSEAMAFYLMPFRLVDFEEAADAAVKAARARWATPAVDTANLVIADQYEYNLATLIGTNITDVRNVWTREDSAHPWDAVNPALWQVTGNPGQTVLRFHDIDDLTAGHYLRIDYEKEFVGFGAGLTATLGGLAGTGDGEDDLRTFLVEYTLYVLHDMMANRNVAGGTFRAHLTQSQTYLQSAMRTMGTSRRYEIPGRIHKGERSKSAG